MLITLEPHEIFGSNFALFILILSSQWYCEFGNIRENFIFANSDNRNICHVKNSRLGHDLSTSVNDNVISPFREGFIFAKLRIRQVLRK